MTTSAKKGIIIVRNSNAVSIVISQGTPAKQHERTHRVNALKKSVQFFRFSREPWAGETTAKRFCTVAFEQKG